MRTFVFSLRFVLCIVLAASGLFAQSTSTKVASFLGTTKFKPGKAASSPVNKIVEGPDADVSFDIPGISGNNSPARVPANFVPRPAGNPFASASFLGFKGLDQFLQAIAFTGVANTFNGQLEPPDQGLAVGNGFVLEPINNAIGFYDTAGDFFGFEAMSAFFGLPPTFTVQNGQAVPPFGPFLSDPRAYYDSVNGHFFVLNWRSRLTRAPEISEATPPS